MALVDTLRESRTEIGRLEREDAAASIAPEVAAGRVLDATGTETDMPALLAELRNQAEAVNRGDLSRPEAMLASQATALQALFVRLTEKALQNDRHFESFMRLALKAQSQCRTTLETLAELKHPSTIFARQANVTTGPQQINNGMPYLTFKGPGIADDVDAYLDKSQTAAATKLTAGQTATVACASVSMPFDVEADHCVFPDSKGGVTFPTSDFPSSSN